MDAWLCFIKDFTGIFILVFYTSVFKDFIFVHKCPSICDVCGKINQTLVLPAFKIVICAWWQNTVRGGADKSLARPGRKNATATKLGINSTYSPRSSIHFLVRCSNFCKPLKKIQKVVRPTRSPWQQRFARRTEKWWPFNCFFSPGNRW